MLRLLQLVRCSPPDLPLRLTCTGNLSVGSPRVFLLAILRQIETAETGSSRVLLLHALKEVHQFDDRLDQGAKQCTR